MHLQLLHFETLRTFCLNWSLEPPVMELGKRNKKQKTECFFVCVRIFVLFCWASFAFPSFNSGPSVVWSNHVPCEWILKIATVLMFTLSISEWKVLYSKCLHSSGLLLCSLCLLAFLELSCGVPGDINIKLLFGSEAPQMYWNL